MPNPGKPMEELKRIGSRNYREPVAEIVEFTNGVPEPIRRLEDSGLELWN